MNKAAAIRNYKKNGQLKDMIKVKTILASDVLFVRFDIPDKYVRNVLQNFIPGLKSWNKSRSNFFYYFIRSSLGKYLNARKSINSEPITATRVKNSIYN